MMSKNINVNIIPFVLSISKGQRAYSILECLILLFYAKNVWALHGLIKHMEILCQTILTENKMVSKCE